MRIKKNSAKSRQCLEINPFIPMLNPVLLKNGEIMQEDQQNNATAEEQTATTLEQTAEARIAELEASLEEAKAQVLYVKAEGENIRRRARRHR
jgi:molecular chaperone GrpE (heat shock protein)